MRMIFFVSRRMTSTCRGSLSISPAMPRAKVEGLIFARETTRPSAFDTIFWAITRMSPVRRSSFCFPILEVTSFAMSSPRFTSGIPLTGRIVITVLLTPGKEGFQLLRPRQFLIVQVQRVQDLLEGGPDVLHIFR